MSDFNCGSQIYFGRLLLFYCNLYGSLYVYTNCKIIKLRPMLLFYIMEVNKKLLFCKKNIKIRVG